MNDSDSLSRLDRIERVIESLAEQHRAAMAELEVQRVNIESLHASVSELHAIAQEHTRAIEQHNRALERDGEHIRALVRIAEIHER